MLRIYEEDPGDLSRENVVKLTSTVTNLTIVFGTTPEFSENITVAYKNMDITHAPVSFRTYQGTTSANYQINNIKLISRNKKDADHNLRGLNILRSWTKPYFGQTDLLNDAKEPMLGAPPDILLLSAYARNELGSIGNIRRIPTVITQLNIPYPSEVDYMPTSYGVSIPVVMVIDITLQAQYAPIEAERFDMRAYREGRLEGW